MIKSMTGYGKSFSDSDHLRIDVEVRSLNSKFLDLSLRVPKDLAEREIELRKVVAKKLSRGKVNLAVEILKKGETSISISYDEAKFQAYYDQLKALAEKVGVKTDEIFKMAVQSPEVSNTGQADSLADQDWDLITKVLKQALDQLESFRIKEGNVLSKDLEEYVSKISALLKQVAMEEPNRISRVRERMEQSLGDLQSKTKVDPNRFEQELMYYLERLDISEEMDRLRSHLAYFRETLFDKESQGKKLGFIAQEMGREINTIGSKANQADIQKLVVAMKDELEKIKEQLYNIL